MTPNQTSLNRAIHWIVVLATGVLLTACSDAPNEENQTPATEHTERYQERLYDELNLDEPLEKHLDYADATRGLIANEDEILIKGEAGNIVWDTAAYGFIKGDAPASVNPSLWRQEKLNNIHGLFEVAEGIYQLRGYDIANMTLIKGDTGWIIVDPLSVEETAKHSFAFAQKHLGELPIKAVIYTHSHMDHFGGVEGLFTQEEAQEQGIRIIAPAGFMEEVTSENILVGLGMGTRASYMYGRDLTQGPFDRVGTGLGKTPAWGTFSLIEPNESIDHTGQTLTIDGLEFVFQYTPESEAPAELMFYLPKMKALCTAELALRSMHNLYTLRGAKVRDALKWSAYLREARDLFSDAEIAFGSHHWPVWDQERVSDYLTSQADLYKFIHDQSVRLINKGYTPEEIAETLKLPESLAQDFSNRGYYGTLKHNAKAVYQFYMGWYDGNPVNLDPLPPEQSSPRYLDVMGGAASVIDVAQTAYDDGEYRWAAELLNHVVFTEPTNEAARLLLADTYKQMGYQAESGPWRDIYLSGANELINGPGMTLDPAIMRKVLYKTPTAYFVKAMSVNLSAERAEGEVVKINLYFEDTEENFFVHIENSVFNFEQKPIDDSADATIYITREFFVNKMVLEKLDPVALLTSGISIKGSKLKALKFARLLDVPEAGFNIVEP